MKIVIAGAGESGTYLAKMLYKANKDIIIIDIDKDKLTYIDGHFDFLTIKGSATSIETLRKAQIDKTNLFIAITDKEETNIIAAILAKKLGARKVIAKVENREYLKAKNKCYFSDLGIDSLVYPEILASEEIVNLLNQTGATKTYEFANGKLSLFTIKLDSNAPILNKTLQEVTRESSEFEYRAVAITRDGKTIIPKGNDKFLKNDLVYVICSNRSVKKLMEYSGKKKFHVKNIMIMGGSRIGFKTALRCENKSYVKLIEQSREKCLKLAEILKDTLIIHGDGRDTELLIEEGIAGIDAFVAVTGSSETNILSCIHAKKLGVRKTIAEIENLDYLPLAQRMGIDTVINKKLIAASHIYAHVMTAQVSSVQCLIETDAEILEYFVPRNSKITRKKLKDLKFPTDATIGGIIRGENIFIARGDTQIKAADKVVLFALPKAINKVNKFFK